MVVGKTTYVKISPVLLEGYGARVRIPANCYTRLRLKFILHQIYIRKKNVCSFNIKLNS